MGFNVILSALWIWIVPAIVSAGVVRRESSYNTDDRASSLCQRYTEGGFLTLDCSGLELKELRDDLDFSAQILLLSNNNFRVFPPQLERFTRLERLDLSNNYLNVPLPEYLQSWINIKTLNLSNNLYESWTSPGFNFIVRSLDLSKNKITVIEDNAFSTMRSLRFLDLSENRIKDLPPDFFSEVNNLETLHLCRNYFAHLPKFKSSSLRSLRISSCQVTNIEADSLVDMTSLLEIDLSMNQIDEIPDYITSQTLQELNLSYNSINKLTDLTFSSLRHLAVLDLRGNDFREIWSTSHFASNPFLRQVHVKGNRWNCEGFGVNLLLTYEFLTKDPPKITDRESLICYYPSNVTQMSWQQAYIQTWHPMDSGTTNYTTVAIIGGIIIGVLLTSCVCRGLVAYNNSERLQRPTSGITVLNLNGVTPQSRTESVELRIPLTEDLPPTYDEALLMPRLNTSFHSLPDFMDEVETSPGRVNYRRSRSIGDLTEHRPRLGDRRSMRRPVDIHTHSRGRIDESNE